MSARLAALVLSEQARLMNRYPKLRRGQAAWDALAVIDPELANKLHGGDADCFYNDLNLNAFYAAVALKEYRE